MSMLAGPKRKKQYVLNPRGKPLYNDDDRFGSKMLQKMGWTKGKGLGAKEHGSVDFVRVNFKCDAAGLGFEDRDDQWTQHEKGFNGFLETLHAGHGSNEDSGSKSSDDEEIGTVGFGFKKTETKKSKPKKLTENISGQSLEERSKQSRARVHYKKYTRGKDLAQYSEKDLANIFGKKVNEIGGEEVEEKSNASEDSGTAEAEVIEVIAEVSKIAESEEGGVQLQTSATSIDDYFRLKMQQKKAAAMQKKGNDSGELKALEEKEEKSVNATVAESEIKQKKRKSKRDEQHMFNEITEVPENTEVPKKKKKRRKSSIDAAKVDNQTETPEIKNKKKKRKSSMEDLIESASITEERLKVSKSAESMAHLEEECKKKKKKRKSSMEELIAENTPKQQKINDNDFEVKKKQKKLKITNDEPTIALDIETPIENNTTANKNIEENVRFSKTKTIPDPKSIRNMKEFHQFYCTYQISSFVAEKFRHLDFKKFRNCNLAQLIGYGQDESLKIQIIPKDNDEFRILELWKHSLDKYSDRKLMREEHKSNAAKKSENTKTDDPEQTTKTATTKATKQNKQKGKKFKSNLTKLKSLKRRSVFKLGI